MPHGHPFATITTSGCAAEPVMESVFNVPPKPREFRRSITVPDGCTYRPRIHSFMSDFPNDNNDKTDMAAVMENIQKKSYGRSQQQQQQQQQVTSHIAQSSHTSLSSSQRVQHVSSNLSEMKTSINEMKNLSTISRLRNSRENLVDSADCNGSDVGSGEPLVTLPDDDTPPPVTGTVTLSSPNLVNSITTPNGLHMSSSSSSSSSSSEMKFEQKRMTSAMQTKVITDGFSAEKAVANSSEMKRLQAGELSYQESSAASELHARLDMEGITAEKSSATLQDQKLLRVGELSQQENQNITTTSMKVQTEAFSSEKKAVSKQQQSRAMMTSGGIYNHHQEKLLAQSTSSQANFTSSTITSSKGMSTKASHISTSQLHSLTNGKTNEDELLSQGLEDLECLSSCSSPQDVERAIAKYSATLSTCIQILQRGQYGPGKAPLYLNKINQMIRKAWEVPTHGHEVGTSLCHALRSCGGLDLLMCNCIADKDRELQLASAQLLEQCLTTENRAHVVENGLDKVVNVACVCTKSGQNEHSRLGTGILEHLFKHSEGTCSDVIRLGGLDAVLFECRKNDVETLRHCAGALANLSLYGGAENQEAMIKRKVPMWLFPLAFHNDDNIKYYACLAIAVLVANKEIEAAVLKSGTLDLVEPFVTSHNPSEFAKSNLAHAHGQSKHWLQRLVPVLSSKREEARNLATFHFCMEAGIKKLQGHTEIFREIGAIEPLKKCASCPNAVASKYAAQALRLMGEEVPHKLSQQVPLWSTDDVSEWVKQIGFIEYAMNFFDSRVDGDLLLQLTEKNLIDDIGITNGIRRRRFTRELQNLKKMADYSSKDATNLNALLQNIAPEFSIYTYSMLNAGVDRDTLRNLNEEQLSNECGISNSIHRLRILDTIKVLEDSLVNSSEECLRDKSLDVFVSYRRSNGSQLASLLKVHLQLRGFSVFIDVERLEAGKFDNNLLQSIRQAKFFLLVLTPKALDRCIGDNDCKDWVHREIVAALSCQCNIIPIIDNFQWPEPEQLPDDMRAVCHFNGVRWIHDYQDACVDKLERFMRGELALAASRMGQVTSGGSNKGDVTPSTPSTLGRAPPSYQRMHSNDSNGKDSNGGGGGKD